MVLQSCNNKYTSKLHLRSKISTQNIHKISTSWLSISSIYTPPHTPPQSLWILLSSQERLNLKDSLSHGSL